MFSSEIKVLNNINGKEKDSSTIRQSYTKQHQHHHHHHHSQLQQQPHQPQPQQQQPPVHQNQIQLQKNHQKTGHNNLNNRKKSNNYNNSSARKKFYSNNINNNNNNSNANNNNNKKPQQNMIQISSKTTCNTTVSNNNNSNKTTNSNSNTNNKTTPKRKTIPNSNNNLTKVSVVNNEKLNISPVKRSTTTNVKSNSPDKVQQIAKTTNPITKQDKIVSVTPAETVMVALTAPATTTTITTTSTTPPPTTVTVPPTSPSAYSIRFLYSVGIQMKNTSPSKDVGTQICTNSKEDLVPNASSYICDKIDNGNNSTPTVKIENSPTKSINNSSIKSNRSNNSYREYNRSGSPCSMQGVIMQHNTFTEYHNNYHHQNYHNPHHHYHQHHQQQQQQHQHNDYFSQNNHNYSHIHHHHQNQQHHHLGHMQSYHHHHQHHHHSPPPNYGMSHFNRGSSHKRGYSWNNHHTKKPNHQNHNNNSYNKNNHNENNNSNNNSMNSSLSSGKYGNTSGSNLNNGQTSSTPRMRSHQNHRNLTYVHTDSHQIYGNSRSPTPSPNADPASIVLHSTHQDSSIIFSKSLDETRTNSLILATTNNTSDKLTTTITDSNNNNNNYNNINDTTSNTSSSCSITNNINNNNNLNTLNGYESDSSHSSYKMNRLGGGDSGIYQRQGNMVNFPFNDLQPVTSLHAFSEEDLYLSSVCYGSNPNLTLWTPSFSQHSSSGSDSSSIYFGEYGMTSKKSNSIQKSYKGKRYTNTNYRSDFNFNDIPPAPSDKFLARAHLIETKTPPVMLLTDAKWDQLSKDCWERFASSQQSEETFRKKMNLWRYLYIIIKRAFPRCGLYLVGSTMTGFGADTSDVDMCLVSRNISNLEPRTEATYNLIFLRNFLITSGVFEQFQLINAKVPILKFKDSMHFLEIDLNYNNSVGIRNTHLLYCYSQLDWRLRPLVLVVKLWAQFHDINNAKNMTISSYSLVLMVIHFLQCGVTPSVLPCLHSLFPEKFKILTRANDFGYIDMNEEIGPYANQNTQPLGELFLKFLEYYSNFDYYQYAISIRLGTTLPIDVCRQVKSVKNDAKDWRNLCIEEPFDLTNTARSVYDPEIFARIKAVFITSWKILEETKDLNTIFKTFTTSLLVSNYNNSIKQTTFNHVQSDIIPQLS